MKELQNMAESTASNEMQAQETLMLPAGMQNKPRFLTNSLYAEEYKLMRQAGFELSRYQLILDLNRIGVMMASPDCYAAVGKPGIVQYCFDEEKHQLIFSDNDEDGKGWIWSLNASSNSIKVLHCGTYLHYIADRMDWLAEGGEVAAVYFVGGSLVDVGRLVFDLDHVFKRPFSKEEQESKEYKDREQIFISEFQQIDDLE